MPCRRYDALRDRGRWARVKSGTRLRSAPGASIGVTPLSRSTASSPSVPLDEARLGRAPAVPLDASGRQFVRGAPAMRPGLGLRALSSQPVVTPRRTTARTRMLIWEGLGIGRTTVSLGPNAAPIPRLTRTRRDVTHLLIPQQNSQTPLDGGATVEPPVARSPGTWPQGLCGSAVQEALQPVEVIGVELVGPPASTSLDQIRARAGPGWSGVAQKRSR